MTKEEIQKKYVGKVITIEGANLSKTECTYNHLWEHFNNFTPEQKNILMFLEKLYFGCLKADASVKQLEIQGEKVVIPETQLCHERNLDTVSQFESYADLGIVASEWFGQLESGEEGRFCAFVKRIQPFFLKAPEFDYTANTSVRFFVDDTSSLSKMLFELDWFKYKHIKDSAPEKVDKMFPKEIIELYENIVLPLSPRASCLGAGSPANWRGWGNGEKFWKAIPGGIPPQLIVGIQVGSDIKELDGKAEEIQKMFPNAVVFDETRKVLAAPKLQQTNTQSL